MPAERPNILMIMADQLPAACVGAYGHPFVKTPNLDRLARQGVTFESAYCNSPICAPSRASMCTGRYVSELGAYDNGSDFRASTPTLMHHLSGAGYEVILSGKMHFIGPDQKHGFHRRLTPEIYPSSFTWTPDWNESPCHNPGTAVNQLHEAGLCDWNLQLDYDEEVRFRSLEALRDLARREEPDDNPFFLCASFTHPHDPFTITREWWDRYDHDEIDMPSAPAVDLDSMHPYNQWLQIHHMNDVYPPRESDIQNARHAYFGMVSYFDHCAGELIDELSRLGLAENTVIILTSDHGEMLGEQGMWFKRTYYDQSARVPLIAAGPGIASDFRSQSTVSLVDLLPTFCEIGKVQHHEELELSVPGKSLRGILSGEQPVGGEDYAISEYLSEGVCEPMRMLVNDKGRWKFVYVRNHPDQLFDLVNDPLEQNNLAENTDHAERRYAMKEFLLSGWDPDAIRESVIESQERRRLIHAANPDLTWDAQPDFDGRTQYVRQKNAQQTNVERRFPRVDPFE